VGRRAIPIRLLLLPATVEGNFLKWAVTQQQPTPNPTVGLQVSPTGDGMQSLS
jgi:hypothetical protein